MIPNDDAAVAEAAAAAASPAVRIWQERVMSLKLHQSAYEYAQKLIQKGQHKCTDIEQAALHLHAILDTLISRKPYMVRQHVRPV